MSLDHRFESEGGVVVVGIAGLVNRWAAEGRKDAFVCDDDRLTFEDWAQCGERLAAGLANLGVGPETRIALVLPNSPELVTALYAAARLGAVAILVSTWSTPDEMKMVLSLSRVEYVIAYPEVAGNDLLPGIRDALDDPATDLSQSILCGAPPNGASELAYAEVANSIPDHPGMAMPRLDGSEPAVILFTSGTTGVPKGVVISHETLVQNGRKIGDRQGLTSSDKAFTSFPFFFSAGLCNALMGSLSRGSLLVTQRHFKSKEAVGLIEANSCTARTSWGSLLKKLGPLTEGKTLRIVRMKGCVPLTPDATWPETAEDASMNMYGMTETAAICSSPDFRDDPSVRLGTFGRPLDGNEIRVVEPGNMTSVATGHEGEIVVRGESLMLGYDGIPASETFEVGGFLKTGDIGSFDADGNLRFHGRLKSMVKTGGFSVYPEEVEAVIATHADVIKVTVLGLPDETLDQRLVALVETANPEQDGVRLQGELEALVRNRLSGYKRPRVMRLLPPNTIQMTGSGKVNHAEAQALATRLVG